MEDLLPYFENIFVLILKEMLGVFFQVLFCDSIKYTENLIVSI